MVPIGCPETSVRNYHYSLHNSPETTVLNTTPSCKIKEVQISKEKFMHPMTECTECELWFVYRKGYVQIFGRVGCREFGFNSWCRWMTVLLTPSGETAMNRKSPVDTPKNLNIHHVFKTEELFLKITTNRSGVSKNFYVRPTCTYNTVLPYRNYFGLNTNTALGSTGGALSREYHALRRWWGGSTIDSVSIRCRRHERVRACVCVAHSNLKITGRMSWKMRDVTSGS